MFEDQDNNAPTGSPVAPIKPVTPLNLPAAEPEDVLASVDPAKAPAKHTREMSGALQSGIPEEYLESSSGLGKRIALIVVGLVAVAVVGGLVYWYVAVRQPSTTVAPGGSTVPTEVNPTPDLKPQGENPKDFNDDSDSDGLSVEQERAAGTDLENPDTDGDGLFDGEEVRIYGTNPLNVDTDGDTFSDADEVRNGFNPKGEGRLFNVPQQ